MRAQSDSSGASCGTVSHSRKDCTWYDGRSVEFLVRATRARKYARRYSILRSEVNGLSNGNRMTIEIVG